MGLNIGSGGHVAANQYVCGDCGARWIPSWSTKCAQCDSEHRVVAGTAGVRDRTDADLVLGRSYTTTSRVRISGIDLSWGDVFVVAFKFCVVLALFQAVFLIVAFLIWG